MASKNDEGEKGVSFKLRLVYLTFVFFHLFIPS